MVPIEEDRASDLWNNQYTSTSLVGNTAAKAASLAHGVLNTEDSSSF